VIVIAGLALPGGTNGDVGAIWPFHTGNGLRLPRLSLLSRVSFSGSPDQFPISHGKAGLPPTVTKPKTFRSQIVEKDARIMELDGIIPDLNADVFSQRNRDRKCLPYIYRTGRWVEKTPTFRFSNPDTPLCLTKIQLTPTT
jgi:hypothetical protein